jgi:hypothetical protein
MRAASTHSRFRATGIDARRRGMWASSTQSRARTAGSGASAKGMHALRRSSHIVGSPVRPTGAPSCGSVLVGVAVGVALLRGRRGSARGEGRVPERRSLLTIEHRPKMFPLGRAEGEASEKPRYSVSQVQDNPESTAASRGVASGIRRATGVHRVGHAYRRARRHIAMRRDGGTPTAETTARRHLI